MQLNSMLSTDLLVSPANLVQPVPLLESKLHRALMGWRYILASPPPHLLRGLRAEQGQSEG